MTSDEDDARLQLLIVYVGREINLRSELVWLEAEFRTSEDPERRRALAKRLARCRSDLADAEMQLIWLRGGPGDHAAH